MLTYRRYCLSLYWWGLLGSDFEIDVDRVHIIFFCFYWNPLSWEVNQASLSQKVAARWCSPIWELTSPNIGECYWAATLKIIIDSVHIIFFCFHWKPISWEANEASLSQKVAARWSSPIGDLASFYKGERYRAATLKMKNISSSVNYTSLSQKVNIDNIKTEFWKVNTMIWIVFTLL